MLTLYALVKELDKNPNPEKYEIYTNNSFNAQSGLRRLVR